MDTILKTGNADLVNDDRGAMISEEKENFHQLLHIPLRLLIILQIIAGLGMDLVILSLSQDRGLL